MYCSLCQRTPTKLTQKNTAARPSLGFKFTFTRLHRLRRHRDDTVSMGRKTNAKHRSTTVTMGMVQCLHPVLTETEQRKWAAIRALDRLVQYTAEVRQLTMLNHQKLLIESTSDVLGALITLGSAPTLRNWREANRLTEHVASSEEQWLVCDPMKATKFNRQVRSPSYGYYFYFFASEMNVREPGRSA